MTVDPGDIEVEAFPAAPLVQTEWSGMTSDELWRYTHPGEAHSEHSSLEEWAGAVDRLCEQVGSERPLLRK